MLCNKQLELNAGISIKGEGKQLRKVWIRDDWTSPQVDRTACIPVAQATEETKALLYAQLEKGCHSHLVLQSLKKKIH